MSRTLQRLAVIACFHVSVVLAPSCSFTRALWCAVLPIKVSPILLVRILLCLHKWCCR